MPESSNKKSHKKRRIKSKPKRRKPKLTKEFQQTEKEVTDILKSTEFSITEYEEDPDALGIAFFCQNVEIKREETPPLVEESDECEGPLTQTASSFINIEDDDPIKRVTSEKVLFDSNILFTPSSLVNPYIQSVLNEESALKSTSNLIRLVNRYHEEGNHQHITSGSTLQSQTTYFRDKHLYATKCEREFHPFFSILKPGDENLYIIPSRKLVTLTIKNLKFTEHDLLQKEHGLANNLEDLLNVHFKRLEKKIISKLRNDLNELRKTVNNILENGATEDITNLGSNIYELQQLREKLHEEEVTSKNLLRKILDNWIELKNLRKNQGFHSTTVKLKIIIKETDLDEDNAMWTKRFEMELNEIYREELESYYRAKRIRQSESENKSMRPKKPSLENIKADLKKTLERCLRLPGEPDVIIIRSNLSEPCRPLEKIKSYFMRICFDGQLVGSSRCFRLEPDLSLAVSESFGIYLDRRIPKEVKVKLYEKKKLPSVPIKIANIMIPLPCVGKSHQNWQIINFSSHKRENISGHLTINFHCEEGIYSEETLQAIFPPPTPRTKVPENMLTTWQGKQSVNFLNKDLPESSPEDQTSEDDEKDKDNTCTFQESLLQFCSREDIDNNQRFCLLTSIFRRDMKTKDIRFVPYLEHEFEEECEEKVIEVGNWMDPIDLHKHNGKKYLRNLYEVVKNHCDQLTQISGHSEELLLESSIMTLKSFFASLTNMFSSSRPLNPKRNAQPNLINYQKVHKFDIMVNVVRATGIPVRAFAPPTLDRRDSSNTSIFSSQTFKYSNVRPYVAASYLDRSRRTTTADGSSPTWNEHLVLQIVGNPSELKGDLKIAIFDECVENHISEERSLEIFQRFQSNWLGEYRLPISTILARQRIEGVFELESPKVLLGYIPPSLNEGLPVESIPEIKERVNIWLYVSVEPSFQMPHIATQNLECSELKEVRHHIREWCFQVKEMQPSRYIDPLVCTTDGKLVCLTRLLEPIPIPIETGENVLESSCRYVSLLNTFKHFDPCMLFRGIWLNNQTVLDTNWGSPKDFGVLLANFMLTVGIRCWVVLGISYPNNESAYVLYQEDGEMFLVDPTTGKKYSSKDAFCPMNKVFCIFSSDNVYCNIQDDKRVEMMSFDIEDTSCWFPMFSKKNPAPLGGVQKLNYVYRSSNGVNELRKNIERKIMKKISTWRPMQKTIWNRAFQSTMLKILSELEDEKMTTGSSTASHTESLFSEFGNYKVCIYFQCL